MKKHYSSNNFYQTVAGNGRRSFPVCSRQKTSWLRFLPFYLFGWRDTAVVTLQPVRIANNRKIHPHR